MSTTTVQINLENQQNHLQDKTANEFLKADEIPEWLSENFFENILRKYFKNDKLKVKSLQIKQCGGKGDSYASTMFRVGTFVSDGILTENSKFQSFIVKSLPDNENAMDKLGSNNYDVQNKEMEMYEKILPKFSKLLEAVNEDSDFFPKVIAVNRVLQVIVLEDLAERKFKMADRLKGLDLDHILMTLRKLARMHAASVMVHSENPKAFSHLDTGLFTRKTDCFHNMFESLCECFIEEVATWEGFEYYATKLEQVRKNLIKNAQRAFDCDDGDLHVLNHGDLWTNNQLFEYDEAGNPIESVLLDFQFSAFGSPALDLIYFLFTSCIDELRIDRMEEMQQYYYYELENMLKKLGYDMKKFPTLHQFHLQILKKYFYVFPSCFVMFPIMISQEKDVSFESLTSYDEESMAGKRRLLKDKRFQAVAKAILPMLDVKGILDEL